MLSMDGERCYLRRLLYTGISPNTMLPLWEKGWLVPKWERYLETYAIHHGSYLAAELLVDMTTNGMTPHYSGRRIVIRPRALGDHECQKLKQLLPTYMQQVSDMVYVQRRHMQWSGLLDNHLDELQVKAENDEKKAQDDEKKAQAKQRQIALIRDQFQRIDSSIKAKADNTQSDPSCSSSSSSVLREKSKEDDRGRSRSPRQRTMIQAEAQ